MTRALGALLLLATLGWGCGGKADPPAAVPDAAPSPTVITRLDVEDATPAQLRPVALDLAGVKQALRAALTSRGFTFADAVPEGAWKVQVVARVVYGITQGEGLAEKAVPGAARALWEAELKLWAPGEPGALNEAVHVSSEAPFDGQPAGLDQAVRGRVEAVNLALAHAVEARVAVFRRSPAQLLAALNDADADVRLAAAARLGMLRERTAVPALGDRLRAESDREVQLRIIGALAEIGDERAAASLIDLADTSDPELIAPIIDALSVIGGQPVEDFLDVLESHDSAAIRELVRQARVRLERNKRPKP